MALKSPFAFEMLYNFIKIYYFYNSTNNPDSIYNWYFDMNSSERSLSVSSKDLKACQNNIPQPKGNSNNNSISSNHTMNDFNNRSNSVASVSTASGGAATSGCGIVTQKPPIQRHTSSDNSLNRKNVHSTTKSMNQINQSSVSPKSLSNSSLNNISLVKNSKYINEIRFSSSNENLSSNDEVIDRNKRSNISIETKRLPKTKKKITASSNSDTDYNPDKYSKSDESKKNTKPKHKFRFRFEPNKATLTKILLRESTGTLANSSVVETPSHQSPIGRPFIDNRNECLDISLVSPNYYNTKKKKYSNPLIIKFYSQSNK